MSTPTRTGPLTINELVRHVPTDTPACRVLRAGDHWIEIVGAVEGKAVTGCRPEDVRRGNFVWVDYEGEPPDVNALREAARDAAGLLRTVARGIDQRVDTDPRVARIRPHADIAVEALLSKAERIEELAR